jgi:hypothetical protein
MNPSDIQKNPIWRIIAKLFLNCLWGKFAQRLQLPKSQYLTEEEELRQKLQDANLEINGIELFFTCTKLYSLWGNEYSISIRIVSSTKHEVSQFNPTIINRRTEWRPHHHINVRRSQELRLRNPRREISFQSQRRHPESSRLSDRFFGHLKKC